MMKKQKTINWAEVHERLKKSQLALQQVSNLEPDKVRAIFHQRSIQLASRHSRTIITKTLPLLAFYLGKECYALPLTDLAEVVCFEGCALMPGAPLAFEGIVNQRGNILPVVNLSRVLGLPDTQSDVTGYILFLQKNKYKVGLKVDRIDQIYDAVIADIVEPKAEHTHLSTLYVKGIIQNKLILLDLDALMAHPIFEEGKQQ